MERISLRLLFIGAICVVYVGCLRVDIKVPRNFRVPFPLWLNCSARLLAEEELVEISWYKDKQLFYSFLPREDVPKKMTLTLGKGVSLINLSTSTDGNVYLSETDLNTTGCFKCEVSVKSAHKEQLVKEKASNKALGIFLPPDFGDPVMDHWQNNIIPDIDLYDVNDVIKVGCRSKASNPPAKITFMVNGKRALLNYDDEVAHETRVYKADGIYSYLVYETERNASFLISPALVVDGYLNVTCVATINDARSGFSDIQTSEPKKVRVLRKYAPVYDSRYVKKQKLAFYGFLGALFGVMVIWYACSCSSPEKEKERGPDDTVSNVSAYDCQQQFRKVSLMISENNAKQLAASLEASTVVQTNPSP